MNSNSPKKFAEEKQISQEDQQRAAQFKKEGNEALEEQKFQEACNSYTKAIELNPKEKVYFSNRSDAYLNLKQNEKALQDGQKAIDLDQNWVKGYMRKAFALKALTQYADAMETFAICIKLQDCKVFQQNLAECQKGFLIGNEHSDKKLSQQKYSDQEQKIFDKLNKTDIENLISYAEKPKTYIDSPKLQQYLQRIFKLESENDYLYALTLGVKIQNNQKFEDGKQKFAEAQKLIEEEEWNQADVLMNKLVMLDSNNDDYLLIRSDINNHVKNHKKALENANKFIMKNNGSIEGYKRRTIALENFDECTIRLEKNISQQIKIEPDNQEYEEKLEKINQKKEEKKDNSNLKQAKQYSDLGLKANKAKDYISAIKQYNQAIKYYPSKHIFYSNRSAAYANKNMFDWALADANECIILKPDYALGYSKKGFAEFNLKQYKVALKSYRKGLELDPQNKTLKKRLEQCQKMVE